MCKMGLTIAYTTSMVHDINFVHSPFSVGSLDLFVASFVFMKGTSCSVMRRNLSRVEPLDRAMANFKRS